MKKTTMRILASSVLLLVLTTGVHGQNTDEWQAKAVALAAQGNIVAAKLDFDKAIQLSPTDASIPNLAGITLAARGDYENAVNYLDKSTSMDSSDFITWYAKGDALAHLNRYNEAVGAYDKSIHLYSDNADAWSGKGNALLAQKGREQEAVDAFDKSLQIKPNDEHVMLNRADALAVLGKDDQAIEAYKDIITLNPDNADAYNKLGQVYYTQGDFENALKMFNVAIDKNGSYSPYTHWKCAALWQLLVKAGNQEAYNNYKECQPPDQNLADQNLPDQNPNPCDSSNVDPHGNPHNPFNECATVTDVLPGRAQ